MPVSKRPGLKRFRPGAKLKAKKTKRVKHTTRPKALPTHAKAVKLPRHKPIHKRVATKSAALPERLLFCNCPERLTRFGAYADAPLAAGRPYRVFYHFHNTTRRTAPLVVALVGTEKKPVRAVVRKGVGDWCASPRSAGQTAMQRFLSAPTVAYKGNGVVRFAAPLAPHHVASGVMTVRCAQDARLRIFFGDNRRVVPDARVVAADAPRRQVRVKLTAKNGPQYVRIGQPDAKMSPLLDGAYGFLYDFQITAPKGRTVHVTFSPRGGHAGLVATVNGKLINAPIAAPASVVPLASFLMGNRPLRLVTLPFGGVFYPVEIAFRLK